MNDNSDIGVSTHVMNKGPVEREIRKNGYFMMIHATSETDDVLRLAATWKLDGLILMWVPGEMCAFIRKNVDTPVVFIDCYFIGDGQMYHNIGFNDRHGGYETARYLLSMGHRDIAFLASEKESPRNGTPFTGA